MSKSIKKISSIVLPNLGFVGGAADGLIQGGGLKGALTGGLKSAAQTALSIGGSQLGSALMGSGGIGNSVVGRALGSTGGKLAAGGMGPPTPATGIIGAISKGVSGLSGALKGAGGGNGLSLGSIGNVISGIDAYGKQDDLEETLLKAQGKAQSAIKPYQKTGLAANELLNSELTSGALGGDFNPGDLTQDPGYQFRLSEGNKNLTRALSASGMRESGAALKAAQEYGQGIADQTYNDAFERNRQSEAQRYAMLSGQSGQGLSAANNLAGIYDTQGNIQANADVARSNIMTGTLSSILSGSGKRQIIGRKADGTLIYADEEYA